MRGYSVLFVCALCVFVLCGAAAVVAQDEMLEAVAAARAARGKAATAKTRGETALENYLTFDSRAFLTAFLFPMDINAMSNTKIIADTLSLPGQVPSKEEIKEEIGRLETVATKAKNAMEAVRDTDIDSLSNWNKQYEILSKMMEVWNKTEKAGKAAVLAAVIDNIPTIDAAIEKAGALKTAAEEAMTLWTAARGKLTAQFVELDAAVAAMNATINDIEEATKKFANNTSPETPNLNKELTYISTLVMPSRLDALIDLKTVLQNVTNAAGDAENEYTALAAAAEELKGKAEERKRRVRIQHHLQEIRHHLH